MRKKQLLFALALMMSLLVTAQSGQKWSTGLNSVSSGDAIGTSNNLPLIFKTNSIQYMSLGTNGVLQLKSLIGSSNSVLFSDANGNLFPLPAGGSNQVLYGNGAWGNLPSIPEQDWKTVAAGAIAPPDIKTKVGIGNTNPQYNLDVTGNVHISTDLIVNNGITLGPKNTLIGTGANGELLVESDFISQGKSNLLNGLNVTGSSIFSGSGAFSGNVDIAQNITFAGGQPGISYITSPKGNIISMLANTSLQGDLTVTGTTYVNQLNINQSLSSPLLVTNRIVSPDTNGIHFGDSSLVIASPTPVGSNPITGA
ncbi:MAG TPA: hypothetical protein VNX01_05470, partial [Bacteroidia bacterium]|nr:hypothetical protein [Bacteroidia bacterium]